MSVDVSFQGRFVFNPPNVNASVGSAVTFYFPASLAHSVTQSSFANPCTYLAASGNSPAGFDSGLVSASTFTIDIIDTQPIWFHCKQVAHCSSGMVGSINAPITGDTFANFLAAAIALGSNVPVEIDHGAVTGGIHGVATAVPLSDVHFATGDPPKKSSLPLAQIVGVAFGSLVPLLLLVFVLIWVLISRRRSRKSREVDFGIARPTTRRETGRSEPIQDGSAEPNGSNTPLRILQPSRARVGIHEDSREEFVQLDGADPGPNNSYTPLRIQQPSRVKIHEDSGEDFLQPDGSEVVDMPPIYDSVVARQMARIPEQQSHPGYERARAVDKRPIVLTYNAHNRG